MTDSNSIQRQMEGPDHEPAKPTDPNDEVVYYQGSPLLRGECGRLALWTLVALVLIVGGYFLHTVSWYLTIALWVAAIVCILLPVLLVRVTRYRITNYRIDYERGLFSKSIDTLELWHVDDISYHQSLFDRILGVGTITVMSGDDTTPQLRLHGLPDSRTLFENLKQRVIVVKRQRGVIKMDLG